MSQNYQQINNTVQQVGIVSLWTTVDISIYYA